MMIRYVAIHVGYIVTIHVSYSYNLQLYHC